ncbi:MAG: hypothetical protein JWO48_2019 [Bryobacterales bacterium]|nr:hypothetical protein [Bryobacterales bacterium]
MKFRSCLQNRTSNLLSPDLIHYTLLPATHHPRHDPETTKRVRHELQYLGKLTARMDDLRLPPRDAMLVAAMKSRDEMQSLFIALQFTSRVLAGRESQSDRPNGGMRWRKTIRKAGGTVDQLETGKSFGTAPHSGQRSGVARRL